VRLVAAAFLLAAFAGQAASRTPGETAISAIDACIPKLDVALDVGYARIAERCPQLTRALERSGWEQWLPRGWQEAGNELSAGSLAELRTVVARESQPPPAGARRPQVEPLGAILAGLDTAREPRGGLWVRFKDWLRAIVERSGQADDGEGWLDRMIQRDGRSQAFIELVTYSALLLVVLLAALIVYNELRAAGLFRSRVRVTAGAVAIEPSGSRALSWRDVEKAGAADKPRVLLEVVIGRLIALRRLPPAGALTARELSEAAQLEDAADRTRLRDLALAAERARYSPSTLPPESVGVAVAQGRELLQSLGDAA
jgi:hypothetical protein